MMTTDDDNPVMDFIWMEFIKWAFDEPEIRAAFEKETGKIIMPPPKSALEAMIDQACKVDRSETIEAFMVWATENLWGMDYAPAKFRAKFAAEK